ncbi:Xanthan lyase precursor [compost metagenome]
MTGVNKVHLAGNVAGSDVGYYFPTAATIKGVREARTASWSSVNTYYTGAEYTTNYTRNFLNMWFDHGTNPTNGTYAYVTLPGKSSGELDTYAANPISLSLRTQQMHRL